MLLRLRADRYAASLPEVDDVLLLMEVADRSVDYDRGPKLALYARAGVREYWVVDLTRARVEAYRTPSRDGYAQCIEVGPDGVLASEALPAVTVVLKQVLGSPWPCEGP